VTHILPWVDSKSSFKIMIITTFFLCWPESTRDDLPNMWLGPYSWSTSEWGFKIAAAQTTSTTTIIITFVLTLIWVNSQLHSLLILLLLLLLLLFSCFYAYFCLICFYFRFEWIIVKREVLEFFRTSIYILGKTFFLVGKIKWF
jgi:hypothetical protein